MPSFSRVNSNLDASGQSDAVHGRKIDISLSGTWTGTVVLQRYVSGAWADTGDSWTANAQVVGDGVSPHDWRLDFTWASGDLLFDLRAE